MASNFDVFGNLNKFLAKDGDDDIDYSYTPGEGDCSQTDEIDLTGEMRYLNGKTLDLTDDSLGMSRSRRAADNLEVSATIDLGQEMNNNMSKTEAVEDLTKVQVTTRSRGRPKKGAEPSPKPGKALKPAKTSKAPKTKRVTYKQALALASQPLPESPITQLGPSTSTARDARQAVRDSSASTSAVDLTGDVHLSAKHCSAPLFQKPLETAPELEYDDEDFDPDLLNIKIKYKEKIRALPHRRHQRYYDLFKAISEQENIPIKDIFILDGDKRIHHDDTPHNTGYKISTFLSCRVMATQSNDAFQLATNKDQIELKFQSDKWKRPVAIKISKLDRFQSALSMLCEQVNFKPEQISLSFDGDPISLKDTPMGLEFEGGEILDCRVKM